MQIATVLCRATLLCTFGIGVYAALAQLLRVDEIAEVRLLMLRKLRQRQDAAPIA
jgi:hypothetical protein